MYIRAIHFTTYFICTLSANKEGPLDLLVESLFFCSHNRLSICFIRNKLTFRNENTQKTKC